MSEKTIVSIDQICQKWFKSEENDKLTLLLEKAIHIDQIGLDKELQIKILKNNLRKLDDEAQENQPNWKITTEEIIKISEIANRIKELGGSVDTSPTFRLYNIKPYVS